MQPPPDIFAWLPAMQERASHTLSRMRVDPRATPEEVAEVATCGWIGLLPAGFVTRAHLTFVAPGATEPVVFTAARMKTLPAIAHLVDAPMMRRKGANGHTLMDVCARNGTIRDLPNKGWLDVNNRIMCVIAQLGKFDAMPYIFTPLTLGFSRSDGRSFYHYAAMARQGNRNVQWTPEAWNRRDRAGDTPLHLYARMLQRCPIDKRAAMVDALRDSGGMDPSVNWHTENSLGDTPARMFSRLQIDVGQPAENPCGNGRFFPLSKEHAEQARDFDAVERMRVNYACHSAGIEVPECLRQNENPDNRPPGLAGRYQAHFAAMGGRLTRHGPDELERDAFGEIPLHHFLQGATPRDGASLADYQYGPHGWTVPNSIGVDAVDIAMSRLRGDLIPHGVRMDICKDRGLVLGDHIPAAHLAHALKLENHDTEMKRLAPAYKPTSTKDSGPKL